MFSIGIDLGGTNIVAAVVSDKGEILSKATLPTPQEKGADLPNKVAKVMAEATSIAMRQGNFFFQDATCIGIGAPGAVDPTTLTINRWSHLDLLNVPLGELYRKALEVHGESAPPIYLDNDANAAALGEFFAGAGRKSKSIVAITLGTGVGGGAVFLGKLFTGCNYAGMEIGHFVLENNGRKCTCGRTGCFEAYSSASALIARTKEKMEENKSSKLWEFVGGDMNQVNGKTVFDVAELDDPTAKEVVEEYIHYLANGVTSLINLLQPEVLCIGGGIAGQKEKLLEPVKAIVEEGDYARGNPKRTNVVLAELGNDAGIIGAALLPNFQV